MRSPRLASASRPASSRGSSVPAASARQDARSKTAQGETRSRVPAVTHPSSPPGCRAPARVTRGGGTGGPGAAMAGGAGRRASRVPGVPTRLGLLDCVERYFAAAPLPDARIAEVGGLDVPVGSPSWPYPARPRAGAQVTADDVRSAIELQQESGLPAALEWICERAPGAAPAVRAAGLAVEELPLLVAADPEELLLPQGVRLYVVGADDPDLPRYERVAAIAFAHPGGRADVREALPESSPEAAARSAVLRERIAAGRTV